MVICSECAWSVSSGMLNKFSMGLDHVYFLARHLNEIREILTTAKVLMTGNDVMIA